MFAELPGFWTSHITLFDRTHESSQCLYGKIQSSLLSVGIGPSWGFIYSSVHSVMLIVSLPDARHEHAFLKQSDFILLGGCFTWNNWHRSYWVRQRRIGADFLCLSLYLLIVRHLLGMSSMVCSGGSCHFQGLVFKNWERRICEVNYITHFFFQINVQNICHTEVLFWGVWADCQEAGAELSLCLRAEVMTFRAMKCTWHFVWTDGGELCLQTLW